MEELKLKFLNNYYVYKHINAKTNVPFYIGKGINDRAYSKASRNVIWKNIVNKYGYRVEFIMTNLNELEAYYLENFYIKLYKRKDEGGTLVNMTDGGDGQSGVRWTNDRRKLMSKKITGKILKSVDVDKLIADYKVVCNLKKVSKMHGICAGTAKKYIPKELREESRSKNGQLNSIRLLNKKPWNYGKKIGNKCIRKESGSLPIW